VRKAYFAIVILINSLSCMGQEVLVGLGERPSLKHSIKPVAAFATRGATTLSLPFFDDFAKRGSIPDSSLWIAGPVDMNQTYGINPPNIGVATLDLLDEQGNLHTNASIDPFKADSLTSRFINLDYPASNDIFLSFEYQPCGKGEIPESQDSLVLNLYSNSLKSWIKAWSAIVVDGTVQENNYLSNEQKVVTNAVIDSFHHVMIQLNQSYFLTDSFRIKFYNIGSLSNNSTFPGFKANADQWNIDLIYINSGRTANDTLLNDVGLTHPLNSLLQNYEAIPWTHFKEGDISSIYLQPDTLTLYYQNLGNTIWNVTRQFEITEELSHTSPYYFSGGAENINPLQSFKFERLFKYDLASPSADSAQFQIKAYLLTDIAENRKIFRWNDTITRIQVFKNYYAYDDGSAENGYGISGEGASNAMVALKFTPIIADTLRGVYLYFNKTLSNSTTSLRFYLKVWSNNNGVPGSEIYSQVGEKPIYTDSLNKFAYIKLDTPIKINETFYVGWKQISADMLNVGFDRNINSQSKLFYNLSGNWINSGIDGTLMIRPVFGADNGPTTAVVPNSSPSSMSIYPNPASESITIQVDQENTQIPAMIYDMAGKLVKQLVANQQVSIGELPNGLYLVRVQTNNGITTKKLIISR
jgi:hypothetical protein